VAILLFGYLAGLAAQNVPVLRPVDEAPQNPDFLAFRTRLKEIVSKHDTKALLEVLHPDIRASFGSDHGIPAFVAMWTLNEASSELWKELGTVLEPWRTFSGPSMFTAPYTFSNWPNDVDSFEFMAIIGTQRADSNSTERGGSCSCYGQLRHPRKRSRRQTGSKAGPPSNSRASAGYDVFAIYSKPD
jgi:hypothetical protein